MEIKLEDLRNKHLNQNCVIVGGSQSMHDFNFENFEGIIIVLGTAILRINQRFKPDYFISSNDHFPVPEINEHLEILNSYKQTTWIFSDTNLYSSIWTKSEEFLEENLKINYCCFDDRHFNKKKCNPEKKCCLFLSEYPNQRNIYNLLIEKLNLNSEDFQFGQGTSVAEVGLAIALYMGFKNIYLQGISMTKSVKYQALKKKNQKYFGYPSKYADDLLYRTTKSLKKKFFLYYLKQLDFKPYFFSIIEKLNNYFSRKGAFNKGYEQSEINFKNLSKISAINSQKIFLNDKDSELINIENINLMK